MRHRQPPGQRMPRRCAQPQRPWSGVQLCAACADASASPCSLLWTWTLGAWTRCTWSSCALTTGMLPHFTCMAPQGGQVGPTTPSCSFHCSHSSCRMAIGGATVGAGHVLCLWSSMCRVFSGSHHAHAHARRGLLHALAHACQDLLLRGMASPGPLSLQAAAALLQNPQWDDPEHRWCVHSLCDCLELCVMPTLEQRRVHHKHTLITSFGGTRAKLRCSASCCGPLHQARWQHVWDHPGLEGPRAEGLHAAAGRLPTGAPAGGHRHGSRCCSSRAIMAACCREQQCLPATQFLRMHQRGMVTDVGQHIRTIACCEHSSVALQALVQRTQQVLTMAVLEGRPIGEVEDAVTFLGLLFRANEQGRQLPISDFYNDAGACCLATCSHMAACMVHAAVLDACRP